MKNLVLIGLFVVVLLLACIGIGYTASLNGNTANSWGYGVKGSSTASNGNAVGVLGSSNSADGYGVLGFNGGWRGAGVGTWGVTYSPIGTGIKGSAFSQRGFNSGVLGESKSIRGAGVWGINNSGSPNAIGIKGTVNNPNGYPGYFDGGQGIKIPVRDTDPANPMEGTIWINSSETAFKMRVNGKTFALRPEGEVPGGKIWLEDDIKVLFYETGGELRSVRGNKW